MPWTRKFPEPIKLKHGRKIATTGQARMLALPEGHQSRPADGGESADARWSPVRCGVFHEAVILAAQVIGSASDKRGGGSCDGGGAEDGRMARREAE
jgi:hypothetical protein